MTHQYNEMASYLQCVSAFDCHIWWSRDFQLRGSFSEDVFILSVLQKACDGWLVEYVNMVGVVTGNDRRNGISDGPDSE